MFKYTTSEVSNILSSAPMTITENGPTKYVLLSVLALNKAIEDYYSQSLEISIK